ncbi:WXG100 family type VII secretion target [Saccharopolyspora taberi]|uniref:WXG100 family type VII secretion target n=1 Tax=Saccharopolyspora taberi TaxID=60895 RepID=A0ABN3VLG3_9PSEU
MSKPMRMEPGEIRAGGTKIGNAGQDCESVHQKLKGALDAEGKCWGNDEAGQEFAKGYEKSAKDVEEGIKKIAKALGDIQANLKQTADDVERRDSESAENIANVPK